MFQRLSSLLFGEVEEVAAELKGPNPCVTEADEEGWMIVNLPGECTAATLGGALEQGSQHAAAPTQACSKSSSISNSLCSVSGFIERWAISDQ